MEFLTKEECEVIIRCCEMSLQMMTDLVYETSDKDGEVPEDVQKSAVYCSGQLVLAIPKLRKLLEG